MNLIEVKNLVKHFDETERSTVLDHIHLSIIKGEILAVTGADGSGKSTLLNILGCLEKPSMGQILINELDISEIDEEQLIDYRIKNIGFIFRTHNLIPELSARENVEFILLLQNSPKAERNKRVNDLFIKMGMVDLMDLKPEDMTEGQQLKVAIARALAPRPLFIVADDPMTVLSQPELEQIFRIIRKYNEEEHITFIFSSKDPVTVQMADRIITLQNGVIISDRRQSHQLAS